MQTYRTAQVAQIIGIHVNTVRLYEALGLIPKTERRANGYRIFTDFHIEQFRLARVALQIEVLQNGLRKNIIEVVKASAAGKFDEALWLIDCYIQKLNIEQDHAEEAIRIVTQILTSTVPLIEQQSFTRSEAAEYLQISIDTLRNWEMNGLLSIKRRQNGYRVYTAEDIQRLKVIRTLRCANYSLSAILRMLNAISFQPDANIRQVIDNPKEEDGIISVCDKLITSLKAAEVNAKIIRTKLEAMKTQFS